MKWLDSNKWFLLVVFTLACTLVYFRFDIVPAANVQAAYVLDRLTGEVRIEPALWLIDKQAKGEPGQKVVTDPAMLEKLER